MHAVGGIDGGAVSEGMARHKDANASRWDMDSDGHRQRGGGDRPNCRRGSGALPRVRAKRPGAATESAHAIGRNDSASFAL